jgi:membrane-associated phospholipid phosphatase
MFNPDVIVCYFILMSIASYNNLHFVLKPILHTLISLLVTFAIKRITARPRPEKLYKKRIHDLRQHEKNFSMPSGDSLQAGNFAIILYVYYNTCLGFLFVPVVMYSRIFYFCHYILDTIAGCTLGIIVSYITYLVIN